MSSKNPAFLIRRDRAGEYRIHYVRDHHEGVSWHFQDIAMSSEGLPSYDAAVGMVERLRADIQAPIIDLRTS